MTEHELGIPKIVGTARIEADHPVHVHGQPDSYYSKWMTAFAEVLEEAPVSAQTAITEALHEKIHRTPYDAKDFLNFSLRRGQMEVMADPAYPYEDLTPYKEVINNLYVCPQKRTAVLGYDLQQWNVGSDVESRVAGLILSLHLLRPERVYDKKRPLRILNPGSARNHSLAVLSVPLPLEKVEIQRRQSGIQADQVLSDFINSKLNEQIHFSVGLGVDFWQLKDEMWSKFLEACRFYPIETRDRDKRWRYRRLEHARDADGRLHHISADFSRAGEEPNIHNGWLTFLDIPHYYDVSFLSTFLHQNYPEQQQKIMTNTLNLTSEDGLIVVQSFGAITGEINPDNPISQLTLTGPPAPGTREAELYPYTTFVYDCRQPEKGFQVLAIWNNGRCEKLTPSKLLLQAATEFITVPDIQTPTQRKA